MPTIIISTATAHWIIMKLNVLKALHITMQCVLKHISVGGNIIALVDRYLCPSTIMETNIYLDAWIRAIIIWAESFLRFTRDVHFSLCTVASPSERLHNMQPKCHRLCMHVPKQTMVFIWHIIVPIHRIDSEITAIYAITFGRATVR